MLVAEMMPLLPDRNNRAAREVGANIRIAVISHCCGTWRQSTGSPRA